MEIAYGKGKQREDNESRRNPGKNSIKTHCTRRQPADQKNQDDLKGGRTLRKKNKGGRTPRSAGKIRQQCKPLFPPPLRRLSASDRYDRYRAARPAKAAVCTSNQTTMVRRDKLSQTIKA